MFPPPPARGGKLADLLAELEQHCLDPAALFLSVEYGGTVPRYRRASLEAARRLGYRVEFFSEVCRAHLYAKR